jgi:hypothetical protein
MPHVGLDDLRYGRRDLEEWELLRQGQGGLAARVLTAPQLEEDGLAGCQCITFARPCPPSLRPAAPGERFRP